MRKGIERRGHNGLPVGLSDGRDRQGATTTEVSLGVRESRAATYYIVSCYNRVHSVHTATCARRTKIDTGSRFKQSPPYVRLSWRDP